MPDYTPYDIVDIILMLGECRCNYQQAAELYYFPDRQHPNDQNHCTIRVASTTTTSRSNVQKR